ncbi:hypothetical protein FOCC_FOCC008342 [Frankliniella occidentalis]|nr:hypothetical protein FOCC_FOCC008342 [Frankliniella occidentalis]
MEESLETINNNEDDVEIVHPNLKENPKRLYTHLYLDERAVSSNFSLLNSEDEFSRAVATNIVDGINENSIDSIQFIDCSVGTHDSFEVVEIGEGSDSLHDGGIPDMDFEVNQNIECSVECGLSTSQKHGKIEVVVDQRKGSENFNEVKKKRKSLCCVKDCSSCQGDKVSFYGIPVPSGLKLDSVAIERIKMWVQLCGNEDLIHVTSFQDFKKFKVGGNHFISGDFYSESRRRLLVKAVPSRNLPEMLPETVMNRSTLWKSTNGSCCVRNNAVNVEDCQHTIAADGDVDNDNPSTNTNVLMHTNIVADEETSVNTDPSGENVITDDVNDPNNVSKWDEILCNTSIKDKFFKAFLKDMRDLKEVSCPDCKEKFWTKVKLRKSCLHNNNCHKFQSSNNMDPGPVPEELRGLSYVEEQLIARVHPIISLYKIKGHQYGYSGNIINFSQDVGEFAKKLPHRITDLTTICTVRSKSCNDNTVQDFHVRAGRVRRALLWLKYNNVYYENVEISEENLNLLPEDGNVMDIVTDESEVDANLENLNSDDNPEEPEEILSQSFVPLELTRNQDNHIVNLLNGKDATISEGVLDWPTIGKEPLSEFNTVGYIAQAFPTLFPTGCADLRDPRNHKVNASDYFKHLFRYNDGRFEEHPRFRFFAMNSLMRWHAIEKGNLYAKKNDELSNLSVDELIEKMKEDPKVIHSIMYHCCDIRGTKAYWKMRAKELIQMIEQLGMPTVFFTLSAADLQWPGLFKLLAPDVPLESLSDAMRRDLVSKHPILVDKYFAERVKSFLHKVLKPKYKAVDHWYRIEYQHRGSPHVHGLLWLEDAPNVLNLSEKTQEEVQNIVTYFDNLICTEHPNIDQAPALVHPCRVELEEVVNLRKDLAELLNKVQRHSCKKGYCQSNSNKNGPNKCRFNFPKALIDNSYLKIDNDKDIQFCSRRNDEHLNKFNPYIILNWRANMDIAPVLSKDALISYLAKYVSKSEPKSKTLDEVLNDVVNSNNKSSKSVIQKLYIRSCSQRDYSAQKVGHFVMGEKYVSASRAFVTVILPKVDSWVLIQNPNKKGLSIVEKYSQRSIFFEKSLWYMCKHYDFSQNKIRTAVSIVIVFPKFNFNPDKVSNEDFFRMKVILHVPWTNFDCFIKCGKSWEEIYKEHQNTILAEESEHIIGLERSVEQQVNEETIDEEAFDDNENVDKEDYMVVSRMLPGQSTDVVDLGRRYLDVSYDWSSSFQKYSQFCSLQDMENFIENEKAKHAVNAEIPMYPNVNFNCEQEAILNLVEQQIVHLISHGNVAVDSTNVNSIPKSVVVQGSAGTGKSLVIRAITNKVMSAFGTGSILILAPTGVAAMHIGGSTIHSKLMIIPRETFDELTSEAARKFCNAMKDVKFILIDEFSMIGLEMLGKIDHRLKQASGNNFELFGGYYVFFFGDIFQLPPVMDTPLYSLVQLNNPLKIQGRIVWDMIDGSIILKNVHRQSDSMFGDVLNRISTGDILETDYNILKTRSNTNLTYEERKLFDDALNLYPTKDKVYKENLDYLTQLKSSNNQPVPICIINAKNNCKEAENASTDQAQSLEKTLLLGVSARVMLRYNAWTENSLVNGAMGTVVDIVYREGEKSPDNMPAVILIMFDDYDGPFLHDDLKVVPSPAITKSWTNPNQIK